MNAAPAIAIEGVTKAFAPGRGVFDVGFAVAPGEIFGFLGPNGAGKTTLIRVLLAYLRPTAGTASILGFDCWRDAVAIRRRIGYVPAEFKLDEEGSAASLLAHLAGFRPPGALDRAHALAERLELPLEGRIRTFSKGMKQKVALIQALMHDPDLLILDEPTEGLDPLMRRTFHDALRDAAAAGRTVFFSSHQLDEVDRLCDRAAVIGKGRILAVEPITGLRARQRRVLRVVFAGPVDAGAIALPGAALERQDAPDRATFRVEGTAGGLPAALAALPVLDFALEPAPLEDAFLEFYR
jgi:ABC-2 type transport system ATP-binding protein